MNKLIKEIVPNIRVSNEARDLLLNCCSGQREREREREREICLFTEFIHLLASEASEISEKQHKKVMSPEHIIEALEALGFTDYVEDVKEVFKEYKEQASVSDNYTYMHMGLYLLLLFLLSTSLYSQYFCSFSFSSSSFFLYVLTLLILSSPFATSSTQKHRRKGKSRLDRLGVPEEELARQQQELFEQARQQQLEVCDDQVQHCLMPITAVLHHSSGHNHCLIVQLKCCRICTLHFT